MQTALMTWVLLTPVTLAEGPPSTKVEGEMIIPKTVASFEGRTVEVRLYSYDPRIADKAADLVDLVQFKKAAHTQGKETKKKLSLGAKGKLDPRRRYYVTLFILDGKKRTHIGECAHRKGLCTVLTNGQPRKITMTIRPVR